jgi:hypothetical protein
MEYCLYDVECPEYIKKPKPILFSTPMVKAIDDDRKTMTRRVPKIPKWALGGYENFQIDDHGNLETICENTGCFTIIKPRYQPEDICYVQEAWKIISHHDIDNSMVIQYRADNHVELVDFTYERYEKFLKFAFKNGWQSPYFIPYEAARYWVRITGVRAEQLQEITEDDVIAEGTKDGDNYIEKIPPSGDRDVDTSIANWHIACFEYLWNSINAGRGYNWYKNLPVFVYQFKCCENPINK